MIGSFKKKIRSVLQGRCVARCFYRAPGFTLIEAVVAAAVAGMLIVSIVGVFVTFQKVQNSSHEDLQLHASARQLINAISEQLRAGYIDYAFYTAAPSAEARYLATRTATGEQTVFQFFDTGSGMNMYVCKKPFDDVCPKSADPTLSADWSQINTDDIQFVVGTFDIQPDEPQFYSATTSDDPQLVTIRMQLSSTVDSTHERSPFMQLTLTPRIYAR